MLNRKKAHAVTGLLLALACSLLLPTRSNAASAGVTSMGFEASVLRDLGIEVESHTTSSPLVPGQVAFSIADSSDLSFNAPGGDFEGFAGGVLRHRGTLALVLAGKRHTLANFELRVAADPFDLELFDATGRRWFLFQSGQPLVRDGVLRLRNVDINVAPELAAMLGRPELAGGFLGQAELKISETTEPDSPGTLTSQAGAAGPCDDVFTADRDVSLIDVGAASQVAREAGGRVAMTFSARLRNTGTSAILWKRAIEPDGVTADVGEHPFLALSVYRILNGQIEQVGRAGVKHAFFSTNAICSCAGGHTIYPNCEDAYGGGTNSNRLHMAPREEVTAGSLSFSGAWTRVGSHFDGSPVDDFRDHDGDTAHDDYEHRLLVQESDLQTGGTYFVEAWYIIWGDVDLFNSMGHDEVTPSFAGSTWSFATVGGMVGGSILDEFVDPVSPPAGSANDVHDTGEGRLQLAVATTDLGGGDSHYEYALMNYDFDRQLRTFSVPLDAGVTVSNLGFSDTDTDAGNDWTPTVTTTRVTWTAPLGNEMDWGTLYSFRFDADAAPVDTVVFMGVLESGTPPTLAFETLGPAAGTELPLQDVGARMLVLALLLTGGAAALLVRRRSARAEATDG